MWKTHIVLHHYPPPQLSPFYAIVSNNAVFVSQGGLGLPAVEYYIGLNISTDATLLAYQSFISDALSLLGVGGNNTRSIATQVTLFEQKLATIFMPSVSLYSFTHLIIIVFCSNRWGFSLSLSDGLFSSFYIDFFFYPLHSSFLSTLFVLLISFFLKKKCSCAIF